MIAELPIIKDRLRFLADQLKGVVSVPSDVAEAPPSVTEAVATPHFNNLGPSEPMVVETEYSINDQVGRDDVLTCVKEAIAETIGYPAYMVDEWSTLSGDLMIDDEKFKTLLSKLGVEIISFNLTDGATVKDLVMIISNQYRIEEDHRKIVGTVEKELVEVEDKPGNTAQTKSLINGPEGRVDALRRLIHTMNQEKNEARELNAVVPKHAGSTGNGTPPPTNVLNEISEVSLFTTGQRSEQLSVASLPLADESVVDGANKEPEDEEPEDEEPDEESEDEEPDEESEDEEPEDEEPAEVAFKDVKEVIYNHAKNGKKFGLDGLLADIKGLRNWARNRKNTRIEAPVVTTAAEPSEEQAKREKKPSLKKKRKERENLQNKVIALQRRLEVATGMDKQKLQTEYDVLITQLEKNQADIEQYASGVAWQSIILTMGASAVARKGLIVGGATLLGTPAALVAVPTAGIIAGVRDTIRARGEGGATRLYQAATQDTIAALTTGRGSERKGYESKAEFQKNRWQGWKRSPLWLLRKVGAVANDPRARLVQGAYGVTRDRSILSKFATGNEWTGIDSLNQETVTRWVENNLEQNPELVMELGRRLNRLAALTEYGALDTAGERGSLLSRVLETHDAQFLEALHTRLDAAVQVVARTQNEEKWQKYLTKWNEHAGYQSDEARKRAERSAKIKGVVASAVGTMMTAGVASVLSYFILGDGVQDVQRGVEQIQTAMMEDLQALQVQLEAGVQGMSIQFSPEMQAQIPWLDGHPLGDPAVVPPGVGGGQLPPVFDHLQAPWPHDPQMDMPSSAVQSTTVLAQPGNSGQSWHDVTHPVDSATVGPQQQGMVDRLQQSVDEVAHHLSSSDTPVVELKTGIPWNDIKQVVSESGVTSDSQVAPNTIIDGLKDFWKALQPEGFDFNNIDQHTRFLSLDGVKSVSELPVLSDGAVGYHLSDSQLTHLAEWWKEAAQVEHPTDLQQIARDLNGLETGQPMLFDELAKNSRAMQQLLDIANGVPSVAEIVK